MGILGKCKNCNNTIRIEELNGAINFNNLTLSEYEKYKNFKVYHCPFCHYVSESIISEPTPENIRDIINSKDYVFVLDYRYLDKSGIDRDFWEHDIIFPAGEYEANALICEKTGEYAGQIRSLFKCVELKEALIRRFTKLIYEDCDECDFTEEYGALINCLKASISMNLKEIFASYKKIKNPNIFTKLILVETHLKANETIEAKYLFTEINSSLDKELNNYFNGILQ